jgi:hypothetical protein
MPVLGVRRAFTRVPRAYCSDDTADTGERQTLHT